MVTRDSIPRDNEQVYEIFLTALTDFAKSQRSARSILKSKKIFLLPVDLFSRRF
jgi:hypothetical protein